MSEPDNPATTKTERAAVMAVWTTVKAAIEALPAWMRVLMTSFVLVVAPTLMVNGYLRGFGQPGLGAFGDNLLAGLLQSAGLFLALLIALVGLILVAPLWTRHFFAHAQTGLGFADHVNTPIFGQAKEAWRGHGRARPGLAYLAGNFSLIGLALMEVAQHRYPSLRHDWLIWLLLGLSPVASMALVWVTIKPDERAKGASFMAFIIGVAFALSAWSWIASLTTLLQPGFPPPTQDLFAHTAMVMGVACLVHFTLSAASHHLGWSLLMIVLTLTATLWMAPGYQMLVFNALRAGNAGGGVPTYYPDPARRTLGGPMKTACLILAAGEYRIVRLTDDPEACSDTRMRKFYGEVRDASSEAERQKKLCGVMPIRREAFAGAVALPPENRKSDDKTAAAILGCPTTTP